MIRSLQPNAMINNRGFDEGDFGTPERDWYEFVDKELAFDKPVEACQSVGTESWGYREDEDYFTPKYLIQCIDKIMAKGGNYLLNVGPRADGTFPSEAVEIIQKIGKWYHDAKESFDNVKPASEIIENRDVLLTRRDNTLYIHLFMEPKNTRVLLNPIKVLPQKAILLNTSEKVNVRVDILPGFQEKGQKCLQIRNLPVNDISDSVLVVKLQFDKLPE
jgi:alpha-L-fucosidase